MDIEGAGEQESIEVSKADRYRLLTYTALSGHFDRVGLHLSPQITDQESLRVSLIFDDLQTDENNPRRFKNIEVEVVESTYGLNNTGQHLRLDEVASYLRGKGTKVTREKVRFYKYSALQKIRDSYKNKFGLPVWS